MAATIDSGPSTSNVLGNGVVAKKPELLQKIEGQGSRVCVAYLLSKDDGVLTISEDRSVRVWLKRESGQYWPSIVHYLPRIPICFFFDEKASELLVGLASGDIVLLTITDDLNALSEKASAHVHEHVVTGVAFSKKTNMTYSCSKDKTIVWSGLETLNRVGSYILPGPAAAIQFDDDFVFIGDINGTITLLKIIGESANLITKLSGHSAAITDLAWDVSRQQLFSASIDEIVVVWDIGGNRGQCFELSGHKTRITKLSFAKNANKLLSADCHGGFVCWEMDAKRRMTPEWKNSDKCEICDAPFLWNVKVMWDRKIMGVRRHHCRTCGISVCQDCCDNWTTFPTMGFEIATRICKTCSNRMQQLPEQYDLTPLAISNDLKYGIISMHIQEDMKKMVTIGYDRVIMLWDISSIL
uniref:FYVE-type domain-containing protein n=1 Tax=Rhabditophanes sp. KR3021 TaxID=114890 RepID=A0AC35U7E2_9BILA